MTYKDAWGNLAATIYKMYCEEENPQTDTARKLGLLIDIHHTISLRIKDEETTE